MTVHNEARLSHALLTTSDRPSVLSSVTIPRTGGQSYLQAMLDNVQDGENNMRRRINDMINDLWYKQCLFYQRSLILNKHLYCLNLNRFLKCGPHDMGDLIDKHRLHVMRSPVHTSLGRTEYGMWPHTYLINALLTADI